MKIVDTDNLAFGSGARPGMQQTTPGAEFFRIPDRPDETDEIRGLREGAFERFTILGFDVRGKEEWRYSDLKQVVGGGFRSSAEATTVNGMIAPAVEPAVDPTAENILPDIGGCRLVFVNGIYQSSVSHIQEGTTGVHLEPLAGAELKPGFGELADFQEAPLTALNTACWSDGVLLELDEGVILEQPINMVFLTDERGDSELVAPRNLIRIGSRSRATLIENFVGAGSNNTLNAPVTEIVCAMESDLRHWKVIREGEGVLHYGSTHVTQAEGSRYTSGEFSFGGAMVRRELHLELNGQNAECDLVSLVMASGKERVDMRTRVDHRAPGCRTGKLYKGIYGGSSRGVFDGLIRVARDAQGTTAHQTNRALLLSDEAATSSIPRLEIYADDVKCSHGSTTGELDEDQLFFLRSRGLDTATARTLLAQAFAAEVLEIVDTEDLRDELNDQIVQMLANVPDQAVRS
ncbi:MAG: Fe-S cluster assembly protein SufD [Gemmatimonadales bacterium]|nr:Fe-S cluster assembly protein SufD [Gemmatimonadales bacterium]